MKIFVPLFLVALWLFFPATLKHFLRESLYEVEAPIWFSHQQLVKMRARLTRYTYSKSALLKEAENLSRALAASQYLQRENKVLKAENERLLAALSLEHHSSYRYQAARVIRRDRSAWWEQVVIDKGRAHGIIEGAAVVHRHGAFGRVRSVHAYTSTVELVSSPNFQTLAHIGEQADVVTFKGATSLPGSPPTAILLHVPAHFKLEQSIEVLSSRIGNVFPPALNLGNLIALKQGVSGYFQEGLVQVNPRLLSLGEVSVAIPLKED